MGETGRPIDDDEILIMGLGGTIAMQDQGQGAVPVEGVADLAAAAGLGPVTTSQVHQTSSGALGVEEWVELAATISAEAAAGRRGVVLTQGTDAIEELAFALDLMHDDEMPVVVTGSMRVGDQPGADGLANLADAVTVARSDTCRGIGVTAVLSSEIHAGALVTKGHSASPAAFESVPGALGWVVEGSPELVLSPRVRLGPIRPDPSTLHPSHVVLVSSLPGADPSTVSVLVDGSVDGVVVAALGGGHVPPSWVSPLAWLAGEIPVVYTTRTGAGPPLRRTYGFEGSERDLLAAGLIPAPTLPVTKVVTLLRLLLAAGHDPRIALGSGTRDTDPPIIEAKKEATT
ncbi:MAG: asparaginase domain-containing protein [Acidimicrobiales bacterium]|nr:asparaginase domain-containing protein [Acidimicrobiales bacterium]